jgi:cell division protein FtsB
VKLIAVLLLVFLLMLQYRIWLGDGGIPEVLKLEQDIDQEQQQVETLQERNHALEAEVVDLKTGLQAIEERARSELGMIRKDEVYYQVIEPKPVSLAPDDSAAR